MSHTAVWACFRSPKPSCFKCCLDHPILLNPICVFLNTLNDGTSSNSILEV
jgi:hypothetical protein